MKKTIKILLLATILIISTLPALGCAGGGEEAKKDKVIKIGHAPYDYEVPVIEITKQIAAEKGYEVDVVEGDIGFMFLSLVQGDIDIWPGIWLPSIHKSYQEKYKDQYELGSAIFEDAPIGWGVPKYVDVDSTADLKGNESAVDGKLVGFEPGSGMMLVSEKIIEGYDLDIDLVPGTLSAMMAEVDYSIEHEEPILFLAWRPHTMMRKYDIKILDDPKGYWEYDTEYWGIREGFKDKSSEIYNFVNNFEMSIDETEEFLYAYQEQDKDVEDLAKSWIEDNRSKIDSWLEE